MVMEFRDEEGSEGPLLVGIDLKKKEKNSTRELFANYSHATKIKLHIRNS